MQEVTIKELIDLLNSKEDYSVTVEIESKEDDKDGK